MKLFKKIFAFFDRVFNKKEQVELLNSNVKESNNLEENNNKNEFKDILKVKSTKTYIKKKKIETLVSVGDGLGIQNKISY